MPLTQTDAVKNELSPGHSPNSADYNLTLLWHPADYTTPLQACCLLLCTSRSMVKTATNQTAKVKTATIQNGDRLRGT